MHLFVFVIHYICGLFFPMRTCDLPHEFIKILLLFHVFFKMTDIQYNGNSRFLADSYLMFMIILFTEEVLSAFHKTHPSFPGLARQWAIHLSQLPAFQSLSCSPVIRVCIPLLLYIACFCRKYCPHHATLNSEKYSTQSRDIAD